MKKKLNFAGVVQTRPWLASVDWHQVQPSVGVPAAPAAPDPLANEPGAESRVAKDASRLGQMIGGEAGDAVESLVNSMFDSSLSDEERLQASADLLAAAQQLDQTDSGLRSASRQISRRVRLVNGALAALAGQPADSEARALAQSLILRASFDFENSTGDVHAAVANHVDAMILAQLFDDLGADTQA